MSLMFGLINITLVICVMNPYDVFIIIKIFTHMHKSQFQ